MNVSSSRWGGEWAHASEKSIPARRSTLRFAWSATSGTARRGCRHGWPTSAADPVRIVAGRWRGRRIDAPKDERVRPTGDRVREAWMSILNPWLAGARVLDLFAGSGALGLEALSRGAEVVDFVDVSPKSIAALRANAEALGAG